MNFFVRHGGRRPRPFLDLVLAFRRRDIGAYIHWLPVTTAFSRDAGRDIWGFPKSVEQIDFHDANGWRTCTVVAGGTHVLTFKVRRGGRGRMPTMPQDAFASRDGVLFKTPSTMRGEGVGTRRCGATLTLGSHRIADELRTLGLPRRALLSTSTEKLRATFEAPQQL